ncbi:energy-coupling factor ABC transporter ATP-binding protein [Roseibium suaedae]|uniref:Biotin transport system ATP-binding protein n=1 Tax=Roseibium suaedae TaxID=735517 RepID=A0A1M7M759_9HYPH|nr:ABC transporter ATP-binding protein [Roseibium suaedae]SHM86485.1 biotin transport system ATP-binding protein [Roseibium suaedae]
MAFFRKRQENAQASSFNPDADPYAVLENVGLEMTGHQVLQDISLKLSERRIGIVGLNGSGKSSLIRLLNGLRLPTSGDVRVFGADTKTVQRDLPRYVGFVFQNPDHQAIFPTVEEEIAFGLTQLGASKTEAVSGARVFLERHGCAHLGPKPFADLSEGQKQLICILAVLVMKPKLLVLDEPMSSLDGLATRRIQNLIAALDQRIIMISHDLSLLTSYDRVLWMEGGRLRMDGSPQDVLPAYEADISARADIPVDGDAF